MKLAPLLSLALALLPTAAPGAEPGQGRVGHLSRPLGFTVSADLGGGGCVGGGSGFTPKGLFEGELTAGYHLGMEISAELSLVLGLAPGTYGGLRPGLSYSLEGAPFYVRAALDLSSQRGYLRARWLLAGGGLEVRFTDLLGAFAGLDTGIPLGEGFGVPILVRAGTFFSF